MSASQSIMGSNICYVWRGIISISKHFKEHFGILAIQSVTLLAEKKYKNFLQG
jgi:hypothetical protein